LPEEAKKEDQLGAQRGGRSNRSTAGKRPLMSHLVEGANPKDKASRGLAVENKSYERQDREEE